MRGKKVWLARGALFMGAMLGASAGAMAAAGTTYTTVTPLSKNVTYSSAAEAKKPALTTFIGYSVVVENLSGNTINNVTFKGTATVATPAEVMEFVPDPTTNCTVTPTVGFGNSLDVTCPIGQLKALAKNPVFYVFFKAPLAVSPVPDDQVTFKGETVTAEGGPVVGNSTNDSVDCWPATKNADGTLSCDPALVVTLGTNNPTNVKSAFPKTGANVFTGYGVPFKEDPISTTLIIPTDSPVGSAEIFEGDSSVNCKNNFIACFSSTLTVPGTFSPYLKIVLREDASNIVKGTKIDSIVIKYTPDVGDQITVGDCASPTTPRSDGLPCIASKTVYKTKNVPGWTQDLDGDFEWVIITTKNGRYDLL